MRNFLVIYPGPQPAFSKAVLSSKGASIKNNRTVQISNFIRSHLLHAAPSAIKGSFLLKS
jgi:hypothetical protein